VNIDVGSLEEVSVISELTAECIEGAHRDLIFSIFTSIINRLKCKKHMTLDELSYMAQIATFDFGYDYVIHLDDLKTFEFIDTHSLLLYYTAVVVVDCIHLDQELLGYRLFGNNVEFVFGIPPK
jgi:hypothetical protein